MLGQVMDNHEAVVVDESYNDKSINILNLNPPFLADKIQDTKSRILNDFYSYFGILNTANIKKERQNVDETQQNNSGAYAAREIRLKPRRNAMKKIRNKFNLNVDVQFASDETMLNIMASMNSLIKGDNNIE